MDGEGAAHFTRVRANALQRYGYRKTRAREMSDADIVTFREELLHPGVAARKAGKSLRDIIPSHLKDVPGATDPFSAFLLAYGTKRARKAQGLRSEAEDALRNRIIGQLVERRGVGTVLTTAGGRRKPSVFTPAPVGTLGQTTSLGG